MNTEELEQRQVNKKNKHVLLQTLNRLDTSQKISKHHILSTYVRPIGSQKKMVILNQRLKRKSKGRNDEGLRDSGVLTSKKTSMLLTKSSLHGGPTFDVVQSSYEDNLTPLNIKKAITMSKLKFHQPNMLLNSQDCVVRDVRTRHGGRQHNPRSQDKQHLSLDVNNMMFIRDFAPDFKKAKSRAHVVDKKHVKQSQSVMNIKFDHQ